jgi:hypothetical protein
MISKCNFSLEHYKETLTIAKEKYTFLTFTEYDKSKNNFNIILLRHDIDYSIEKAFVMAKLEHDLGIKSTYFILLNSDFYNPHSSKNIKFLKEILLLGHEIGLHYDSDEILETQEPNKKLQENISQLENLINQKISVVSQHNPTVTSKLKLSDEFIDVRESSTFTTIPYISDSVQNWRSGCMCNHINNKKILQILVHPIWWTKDSKSRHEILDDLSSSWVEQLDEVKKIHEKYLKDLKNN